MKMKLNEIGEHFHISMEEHNGKTHIEKELCFWVRVKSLDVLDTLENATKTTMVQAQFPLKENMRKTGQMRIRLENGDDASLTTKLYTTDSRSVTETTVPLTVDIFDQMLSLTERHLKKVRYTVPIDDKLKWEFDVHEFLHWPNGEDYWIKVDLEIEDDNLEIPVLPFETEEIITCGPTMSAAQRKQVDLLMDRYSFSSKKVTEGDDPDRPVGA